MNLDTKRQTLSQMVDEVYDITEKMGWHKSELIYDDLSPAQEVEVLHRLKAEYIKLVTELNKFTESDFNFLIEAATAEMERP